MHDIRALHAVEITLCLAVACFAKGVVEAVCALASSGLVCALPSSAGLHVLVIPASPSLESVYHDFSCHLGCRTSEGEMGGQGWSLKYIPDP